MDIYQLVSGSPCGRLLRIRELGAVFSDIYENAGVRAAMEAGISVKREEFHISM
jgi:hypothetical protein